MDDLLKQLTEVIIEECLGYEKYDPQNKPKTRNGHSKKSVHTKHRKMELKIPRDRDGDFEPVLAPKYDGAAAKLPEPLQPRNLDSV